MLSFRSILALGIALGTLGLVTSTTISRIENPHQSTISPVDALIAEVSPFWSMPDIFEASQFSVTFPIPIENTTESELLPKGKITLYEADGTQLRGIGAEWGADGFLGTLVDFLPINDGNITLAPNTAQTFEVLWLGFGDQFLADDGTVTTVFTTPSEHYQDFAHLDITFWQKAEITERSHLLTLKTELSTWSPSDGSETKQEIEDQTFTLRYPVLTTRLNTGLVVNLAVILILLLLLWEWLASGRKKSEHISELPEHSQPPLEEFDAFEAEAKALIASEAQKKKLRRSVKKIPKSKKPIS